ncbi:MAG: hypothetical protein AAGG11_09670 [Pseudomonadota bacterium]
MPDAAPFSPADASGSSRRYSMAGDDCSLHFDLDTLTPKQQQDHRENQLLTAMLQVALLGIANPQDEVSLYDRFAEAPWADALNRYRTFFDRLGLQQPAPDRIGFYPMEGFYEAVARAPRADGNGDQETLYMVSGSNRCLHQSEEWLTISRNLNSKLHFAEHAPAAGIPVPATLLTHKGELESTTVSSFFATHQAPVMLKIQGLAGARNVTRVESQAQALAYVEEFADDLDVLLQAQINNDHYVEMTADLTISDQQVHMTNVRQILFANGLWVGNLLGPRVTLTAEQQSALLGIGDYARDHGYTHPAGINLGIDFFLRRPTAPDTLPPLLITELNARWTGGLFPAEFLRQLEANDTDAVAFIDLCPEAEFERYLDFIDDHLAQERSQVDVTEAQPAFSIVPMGFCPYPQQLDGTAQLFVWQIVLGDFAAFARERGATLSALTLPTVPAIVLPS